MMPNEGLRRPSLATPDRYYPGVHGELQTFVQRGKTIAGFNGTGAQPVFLVAPRSPVLAVCIFYLFDHMQP